MHFPRKLFLFFLLLSCLPACKNEPAPVYSPEEALAGFQLADGLQLELVASEPLVQDPVAIAFDEDGRLWVVEMLGFMPDIDGTGEDKRVGRVSVLTDQDGDGQMDVGHVFLDSLLLPRAIAIVNGGILIAESVPLWYALDTDGDLKADQKIMIDSTYGGRGLIEHAANGLWRGMDNWYYNAKSNYRYRLVADQWIRDTTEFRGQWGMSHDDAGRLFYNYNWSQLHADLVPPNYFFRNPNHKAISGIDHGLTLNRRVYPIRPTPAINRGYVPGTLDEDDRMLEFASACSPFVYRGEALGENFRGNAFVCEPTANLIKRNIIEEDGFMLSAKEAYSGKEFLASTDERFRPVYLSSGPDDALYVVDMYRGIVQHGPYMTPYLRKVTLERKLDQHIHLGRIWRIVPKNHLRNSPEKLSEFSSKKLVALLAHPSGWKRDMAQRLLVDRQDQSIINDLKEFFQKETTYQGRLQALWTLDGLGYNDAAIYIAASNDPNPQVQNTALRLLESLAKKDSDILRELESILLEKEEKAPVVTALQLVLSAGSSKAPKMLSLFTGVLERFGESPIIRDAILSSIPNREFELLQYIWENKSWPNQQVDRAIFLEILTAAIMKKGDSTEISQLKVLLNKNSGHGDWATAAVRQGIKIARKKEDQKNQPTNQAIHEIDSEVYALGRQQYLSLCAACHGSDGAGMKRFAPPLINSEWVLGDEKRLALILLQGMEGPISVDGISYNVPEILPVMPSLSVMNNGDLAAVMTYIRNEWGHSAPPVKGSTVGHIRYRTQGKITPWTAEALLNFDPETIQ